jgi:2'-5' RNA ligase
MSADARRRLFFALWPDEGLRAAIVERRERLGALSRRRVPDHNLHLTLLFLGDQPADRLGDIEAAADGLSASPGELVLDRFGWFAGARVVWLGGEPPRFLNVLSSRLYSRISALGLSVDARPFRPHVTLFRKVSPRPELPEVAPLRWPVRDFALIESISNCPYQVLRTYSLD